MIEFLVHAAAVLFLPVSALVVAHIAFHDTDRMIAKARKERLNEKSARSVDDRPSPRPR